MRVEIKKMSNTVRKKIDPKQMFEYNAYTTSVS